MTILRVLIVVALQTVALAYMILDRQQMLNASRVVTLKVVPVDPSDMFRGDYVVLSYDISRLDLGQLDGDDELTYGDVVYVTLVRGDGVAWKPVALRRFRPFEVQGGIALRAKVESLDKPDAAKPPIARLSYGIESYFVPQGTGLAIEDEARKGELNVDVAVDNQGRSAIRAMRRKDQVFYVEGIL
jgi:uncharacterized membrane-anchored protein